jgi:septin 7
MQTRIPFAVVGSTTEVEVGGRKVRGRKYPWGVIEGPYVCSGTML